MFVSRFKVKRTDVVKSGVATCPVIKDFDVFKDTDPGLLAIAVSFFADQFIFQTGKEGFNTGVVVTIALAAHGAPDLVFA